MDELVSELEACLADLDPSSEEATMISRRPVRPAGQPRPARRRRRIGLVWPILAVLAIIGIAALAAWGALALRDDGGGSPAAATNGPIRLSGIGAFDPPPGDGAEHDGEAPNATDGDPGTYWTTETYNDFSNSKPGVGLVLDAGKNVEPKSITVTTDTPGFTAQIRDSDSPQGPFQPVSDSQTVEGETTFDLDNADARYFVVWITDLDSRAHVNEVKAA
jgi:eukaryotic-like serine/threonine-protein kinase